MALEPGQRLAHYEVKHKLGEGGMGEVWRAHDTRLGRDVALKVLPADVAHDEERLARFRREAQLLAALNHPNIAAIHGIEEAQGTPFLVLELVEGQDLAERLKQGPLDVAQALDVARQIAVALEQAHERGVVHRDLKPANVKLTRDGKVKVLDFGLAKAFETQPGAPTDLSRSPTMTAAATRAGIILGTAAYMSPEQARGDDVDKRADIWAFGCVLFEMLSGRTIFAERTVSDTLASVLKSDPRWEDLPADVPRVLRALIRRCLEKDATRRLRDIGEARIVLENIAAGTDDTDARDRGAEAIVPRSPARALTLGLFAVVLAAAGSAFVTARLGQAPAENRVRRFEITSAAFQTGPRYPPAISPDGTKVVFVRGEKLWIRDLSRVEARELAGSDGATMPCWSPDGRSLAFYRDNGIFRADLASGEIAQLAARVGELSLGGAIAWGAGGKIVFSRGDRGVAELPALGGEPRELLAIEEGTEADQHEVAFLPGEKGMLYVSHTMGGQPDSIKLFAGGERHLVLRQEGQALLSIAYSPTGHILYARSGSNGGVWALPFSLDRLAATGEPFLIAPGGGYPSVAEDGSLLYVADVTNDQATLVLVDAGGGELATVGQPQEALLAPSFSPDGRFVAAMAIENENWDIWIHDLERGTRSRLTFGTGSDWDPVWMPDGGEIIFWEGSTRAISRKPADGTGETTRIVPEELHDSGTPTLSPDGKWMAFWVKRSATREDIWIRELDRDGPSRPFLESDAVEAYPRISPDGRYLAYESDESGRREIYLTRFPEGGGKWQVSIDGGKLPRWHPRGDRLYFVSSDTLMEVGVVLDPAVRLSKPRRLFSEEDAKVSFRGEQRFDVSPDGTSFVAIRQVVDESARPRLVLVQNWLAEFR